MLDLQAYRDRLAEVLGHFRATNVRVAEDGEDLAVICDLPSGTTLLELMDLDEAVRHILPRSYVATREGLAHWPSGRELLASAITL